jgi:hypothetical protein
MIFFFKSKILNIDCFTCEAHTMKYTPVDYTHKFYPEWWKKLEKNIPHKKFSNISTLSRNTMKGCVGFVNFFQNSITLPLWSDLCISMPTETKQYDVIFSDNRSIIERHDNDLMEGLINPKDYVHVKIVSPWQFSCKEDIQWAWVQHTWNFKPIDQIIIPPAVIDYKYQSGTNVNFFAARRQKEYLIPVGQPLVNIIPLSDKKIKIHRHLVSYEEHNRIIKSGIPISFRDKYKTLKKIVIQKENENKKKCPFGF